MKAYIKKRIIPAGLLVFGLIIATSFYVPQNQAQVGDVIVKVVDPLIKVTPDLSPDIADQTVVDLAKGEDAHLQLTVWNKQAVKKLTFKYNSSIFSKTGSVKIQRVGYVSIKEPAPDLANKVQSSTNNFPDPLLPFDKSVSLEKGAVTSFWISFTVPEGLRAGRYDVVVICEAVLNNGKVFTSTKKIQINVYSAVAIKSRYPWIANWTIVDIPTLGPGMKKLKYLNRNTDVTPFDRNYWDKICTISSFMKNTGQNVVMMSPQRLAQYWYDGDQLLINFNRFDSMLACYQKNGLIGRLEGWQVCSRSGNFESNYVVHYIKKDSLGNAVFANGQPEDTEVQKFYKIYLAALIDHLKKKNLFQLYYQHIADEPLDANADSYIRIIKMIKGIAPELKTFEPIQTMKVADYLDIPIPSLDYLASHSDYFEGLVNKGKEVWTYTAFVPQSTYANRFIEQQALKHRLLCWILARYNLKGMLNWGFNYWDVADPFKDLGKKSGRFILPAGDSWLVYLKENGLLSSVRLETIKDGINDYALLQQLKQRNPRLATELIDKVIIDYKTYITDINAFRLVRKNLLQALN